MPSLLRKVPPVTLVIFLALSLFICYNDYIVIYDTEVDMESYSVLLVDDEEEVIQVIMKKINWEGLGFSVAGYANNAG